MSRISEVSTALKEYVDAYENLMSEDQKTHTSTNETYRVEVADAIEAEWQAKEDELKAYQDDTTAENEKLISAKHAEVAGIIGLEEDEVEDIASIVTIYGAIEQAEDEVEGWIDYLQSQRTDLEQQYEEYFNEVLGDANEFEASFGEVA